MSRRRNEPLERILRQRTPMMAAIEIDVEAFQARERTFGNPVMSFQPSAERFRRFQIKIAGLDGEPVPLLTLLCQPFGDLRSADLGQSLKSAVFHQTADAIGRLSDIVGRVVLGGQEPFELIDVI